MFATDMQLTLSQETSSESDQLTEFNDETQTTQETVNDEIGWYPYYSCISIMNANSL